MPDVLNLSVSEKRAVLTQHFTDDLDSMTDSEIEEFWKVWIGTVSGEWWQAGRALRNLWPVLRAYVSR